MREEGNAPGLGITEAIALSSTRVMCVPMARVDGVVLSPLSERFLSSPLSIHDPLWSQPYEEAGAEGQWWPWWAGQFRPLLCMRGLRY